MNHPKLTRPVSDIVLAKLSDLCDLIRNKKTKEYDAISVGFLPGYSTSTEPIIGMRENGGRTSEIHMLEGNKELAQALFEDAKIADAAKIALYDAALMSQFRSLHKSYQWLIQDAALKELFPEDRNVWREENLIKMMAVLEEKKDQKDLTLSNIMRAAIEQFGVYRGHFGIWWPFEDDVRYCDKMTFYKIILPKLRKDSVA